MEAQIIEHEKEDISNDNQYDQLSQFFSSTWYCSNPMLLPLVSVLRELNHPKFWETGRVIPREKTIHCICTAWSKVNTFLKPAVIQMSYFQTEATNYLMKGYPRLLFPGKINDPAHVEQLKAQKMIHFNSLKRLLGKWEPRATELRSRNHN